MPFEVKGQTNAFYQNRYRQNVKGLGRTPGATVNNSRVGAV